MKIVGGTYFLVLDYFFYLQLLRIESTSTDSQDTVEALQLELEAALVSWQFIIVTSVNKFSIISGLSHDPNLSYRKVLLKGVS